MHLQPKTFVLPTNRLSVTIAICAALSAGCAGNGEGLDQNGRPSTPGSAGTALTADFNSIQDNVFTPVCAQCHSGATAPRGLRLDAANSYALLVGVASGQVPSVQRVQPGNPAASYLIQKLQGTAAVGQRMPLGGPFLPQSTVDVISEWIRNGAPRPTNVIGLSKAQNAGMRIDTTAPLDGDVGVDPVAQLVIAFDRELDVSRINPASVSLSRGSHSIAVRMHVPVANPSVLLITPLEPLGAGDYRLVVRGSGGGALAGVDAQVLNARGGEQDGADTTIAFNVAATAKVTQ